LEDHVRIMVGDVNWNQLWMEEMSKTSWSRLHGEGAGFWDERAKQLDEQRRWNLDREILANEF
jgi:hypothetical protein